MTKQFLVREMCKACQGTGWTRIESTSYDPTECPRCAGTGGKPEWVPLDSVWLTPLPSGRPGPLPGGPKETP